MPGRRAHQPALCLRGAPLGAEEDAVDRRVRRLRRQYPCRQPGPRSAARASTYQRRRQRGVDLRQGALPGRWPHQAPVGQAVHPTRRQAGSRHLERGFRGDRQGQSGIERGGRGGRPPRLRDDVRGQEAARCAGVEPARRPPDGHGLRGRQPCGGQLQLDLRRDRDRRCHPHRRQQRPLGGAAGQRAAAQGGQARRQGVPDRAGVGHHVRRRVPRRGTVAARRPAGACFGRAEQGGASGGDPGRHGAGQGRAWCRAGAGRPVQSRQGRLERLQRAPSRRQSHGRADARLRAEGRHRRSRRGQAEAAAVARRRRGRLREVRGFDRRLSGPPRRQGRACGRYHPPGRGLYREGRHVRQHRRARAVRRAGGLRAGRRARGLDDPAGAGRCPGRLGGLRQLRRTARGDGRRSAGAGPRGPGRLRRAAASERREGRRCDQCLSGQGLLPHQPDRPRQRGDAALLGGTAPG